MEHKRILLCAALLATCYLIGVTWAETSSSLKPIQANVVANATNSTNNISNNNSPTKVVTDVRPKSSTSNNSSTTPKCVCNGALLPQDVDICPECKCQHEARNTTLIKVVVIIVIWIISILVIYMLFLMCLDPLLNKRIKANYQEHTNEDDDTTSVSPPLPSSANQELNSRANVLNRVGVQQDKWKRQVREQRRHIYDRRTMLN